MVLSDDPQAHDSIGFAVLYPNLAWTHQRVKAIKHVLAEQNRKQTAQKWEEALERLHKIEQERRAQVTETLDDLFLLK